MEDRDYLIMLYDFYGELFNDKQRRYFEDYYFDNLSLSEMSENFGVSRNSVYKIIKRVGEKLYFYEEKLQLYGKFQRFSGIIKKNIDDREKIYELEVLFKR